MNTANEWYEMCLVKKKLDDTMLKIDDWFIDLSDGCEYKRMYCGNRICRHEDHLDSGDVYAQPKCTLEDCPIIAEGVEKLK